MKHLLFSILFPVAIWALSLGHRYFLGAPFPPIDIMVLAYLASAVFLMISLFDDEEMSILHPALFILGVVTAATCLTLKQPLKSIQGAWSIVNGASIVFMTGFLAVYLKYFIIDEYEQFRNRHY